MNKINLKTYKKLNIPKELKYLLKKRAGNTLKFFGFKNSILDIYITNDEEIKYLNSTYRQKDKPTDVLSFNINENIGDVYYLGEIVISYETALKQAIEYNVSLEQELTRLLVHGIVHLMGYDHERSKKDHKAFFEKQESALAMFN
ncbi:MAG: rRNA maturation RNase YbeY [Hydrogenobaculum sp.]|nr:MAG: rRNA maturation RNase YbeY [Hydrogenobaculum sp.]